MGYVKHADILYRTPADKTKKKKTLKKKKVQNIKEKIYSQVCLFFCGALLHVANFICCTVFFGGSPFFIFIKQPLQLG